MTTLFYRSRFSLTLAIPVGLAIATMTLSLFADTAFAQATPSRARLQAESTSTLESLMRVYTDVQASGGQYIATPSGTAMGSGAANLRIYVGASGNYRLQVRVLARSSLANSMTFRFDNLANYTPLFTAKNAWQTVLLPQVFYLTAGTHTLRILNHEATVGLDIVELVPQQEAYAIDSITDPTWTPIIWRSSQVSRCSSRYPLVYSENPTTADVNKTLGQYTGMWPNVRGLIGPERFSVVWGVGGKGPAVRARYDADGFGLDNSVMWISDVFGDQQRERACLRYDVYFAQGFDFRIGGKLPGLYGGVRQWPASCEYKNGYNDDFHARIMFGQNGLGVGYLYSVNKPTLCGMWNQRDTVAPWRREGDIWFPTGRWITVEEEVILNDPALNNGVFRAWVNGVQMAELGGIAWRRSSTQKIRGMLFHTFHGGSDISWAPTRTSYSYFRNFRFYAP